MIVKGTRLEAHWFEHEPNASLAGMQMKFSTIERRVTGVVRHLRGDHPTEPTAVRIFIDPETSWTGPLERPIGCTCDHLHVRVEPRHVIRILGS